MHRGLRVSDPCPTWTGEKIDILFGFRSRQHTIAPRLHFTVLTEFVAEASWMCPVRIAPGQPC